MSPSEATPSLPIHLPTARPTVTSSRALFALSLLAAIAYLNADRDRLFFDDIVLLVENPRVADLDGAWSRFWTSPLSGGEQAAHLTFAGNYALNRAIGRDGLDATSFLVVNVLLHGLNAWLLYLLIVSLLRRAGREDRAARPVALAVAILFVVHPLHASSVAYIVQRRGIMATGFYLLGMLCWLGMMRRARPADGPVRPLLPTLALLAGVLSCAWLGFRSKSMALTLPAAFLMVEFVFRAPGGAELRRFLRWAPPALAILAVGLIAFLSSQGLLDPVGVRIRPHYPGELWGPWTQLLSESRALLHYLKLILLPLPRWRSIDHEFQPSTSLAEPGVGVALLLHAGILALALRVSVRRWPLVGAGILWFYLALLPYVLLPQPDLFVEYKTYLPSIGVCLVFAGLLHRAWPRLRSAARVALVGAPAAALLLLTLSRNVVYRSPLNLWTDAVSKAPNRPQCRVGLGGALFDLGRYDEAEEQYQAALRLDPNSIRALCNLAMLRAREGRHDEVIERYRRVLEMVPDYYRAHHDLAVSLRKTGNLPESIEHFTSAIRSKPDYYEAFHGRADALAAAGRAEEALEDYRQALRLKPDAVATMLNLGNLLADLGRTGEALPVLESALRITPRDPLVINSLGSVLRAAGRIDEAIERYQEALRLDPGYPAPRINLGNAARLQGKPSEAIEHYRRAIEIAPHNSLAHLCLGSAYADQGHTAEAIREYGEALRLDETSAPAHYAMALALGKLGRTAEAADACRRALRLQPGHTAARRYLESLAAPLTTTAPRTSPATPGG